MIEMSDDSKPPVGPPPPAQPPVGPPPPAQPLAPGNFDRAWNDPPLFSYSASSGQPLAQNRLNKRVAFPTQQRDQPSVGLDPTQPPRLYDAGMKPPTSSSVPGPPPPLAASVPATTQQYSETEATPVTQETVQNSLVRTIEKFVERESQEEVKRRLAGLLKEWGRFNTDIQQTLNNLAQALDREDLVAAEGSFTVLTADWSSVIGPGNIMIIKKILYAVRLALQSGQETQAVTQPL